MKAVTTNETERSTAEHKANLSGDFEMIFSTERTQAHSFLVVIATTKSTT